MTVYHNISGNASSVSITGRSLAQQRRSMSAVEKACFAADWIEGKVIVPELTAKARTNA